MYTLILYDSVSFMYHSDHIQDLWLFLPCLDPTDQGNEDLQRFADWMKEFGSIWWETHVAVALLRGKSMYRYGLMEIDVPQIEWFIYSVCMCLWLKILWKGMMTRGTPMTMETSIYVKMQHCILGRLDKFYGQPLSSSLGISTCLTSQLFLPQSGKFDSLCPFPWGPVYLLLVDSLESANLKNVAQKDMSL